ncbi:hypothetical protein RchiOBHm_Chr7g0239201 [Rosa chinensis]|uniref:Uncharacterized protein n=1 Tax=Rosa chinensis TaxID=74649 RepID=A0A2P6PHM3_ROSCH|nr:hypothetical protein RchiOBHm_Chr7g0239201 [Rosa chinensis]
MLILICYRKDKSYVQIKLLVVVGSPSFLPSPPNLLLQDQPICYFRDPQLARLVSELSVCPRLIPGQTQLPLLLLHQLWFSQFGVGIFPLYDCI